MPERTGSAVRIAQRLRDWRLDPYELRLQWRVSPGAAMRYDIDLGEVWRLRYCSISSRRLRSMSNS
jgi:hypothetical protein